MGRVSLCANFALVLREICSLAEDSEWLSRIWCVENKVAEPLLRCFLLSCIVSILGGVRLIRTFEASNTRFDGRDFYFDSAVS